MKYDEKSRRQIIKQAGEKLEMKKGHAHKKEQRIEKKGNLHH
jgi:hypothetical protein